MKKGNGFFCLCLTAFFILVPAFLHGMEEANFSRVLRVLDGIPEKAFALEERSLLADYGGFESSLFVTSQISDDERPAGESAAGTFVLAVPLDADFAVETALAVAEKIGDNRVNVLVAFLGGEKNALPEEMGGVSHKGLRDLLTLTDLPENRIVCYFDAAEAPDEIVLCHGIRQYVAPLEIIKLLPPLFASVNIPWSFKNSYNSFYKLGLAEGHEALSIIWGEEINGFVLSGKTTNGTRGQNILPGDLAELFLEYADALRFPVINPDKDYSLFMFSGETVFFAGERIMVTLFLITAGIFLFFYLLYSVRYNAILVFYSRMLIKSAWIFLLHFLFLLFSLKLSGFLYSVFASFFDAEDMVTYPALVLMFLLSTIVFSLSAYILETLHAPLRERLYSFASVIFIVCGVLSAAFIDISVIPVFIWALLFVFAGCFVSNAAVAFVSALALPAFALFALVNTFETDSGGITRLFLSASWNSPDGWTAIFLSATLLLPSFLLVKRGIILLRGTLHRTLKPASVKKNLILFISVMTAVLILSMPAQIYFSQRHISRERRFISEQVEASAVLEFSLDEIVFQDSRIITVTLAAKENPVRFDLFLASGTEKILPPIYSSPVPFEWEDEGKKIRFSLGENPPNPLTFEIVLPAEFEGLINASAIYNVWDPALDSGEKPASEDYILEVSRSLNIGSI